jgi:CheY-like chemotaxis protein
MGRRVVLVVEADDTLRGRLLDFLGEELGLAVASARDGAEALERAVRVRPAAVLLGRPAERNGAELARRLRRAPGTGQSWIIGAVPERGLTASCHDLLSAPMDLDDLRWALARALARSRSAGSARLGPHRGARGFRGRPAGRRCVAPRSRRPSGAAG